MTLTAHLCTHGKTAYLLGCSQHLADFEDGVYFTGSWEQGSECVEFGHDAAHRPHVDGRAVGGGPEQHLWSTVPAEREGAREGEGDRGRERTNMLP